MIKTKEWIAVMQAYVDGKQIQRLKVYTGEWEDVSVPMWNWQYESYRVKPEPKYRPYKDTEEMIADFKDRFDVDNPSYTMPLIWVKNKESASTNLIYSFYSEAVRFAAMSENYEGLFDGYVYLDGTPCGKLVE